VTAGLLTAAVVTTLALVPQPDKGSPVSLYRNKIESAASACGVRVKFFDLPEATVATPFGFDFAQRPTATESACFSKRLPVTRVGFIGQPTLPKKKN
jgi:hypothetical protein